MDIYELLSKGANLDEIQALFNAEMATAQARVNEEKEAAAQAEAEQAKVEALKCEGRAHLVNAIFAYGEAYGIIDESDINDTKADEIADFLADAEEQLEELIPLFKMLQKLEQEEKVKEEPKRVIKIKKPLDSNDANKIIKSFLDGLL